MYRSICELKMSSTEGHLRTPEVYHSLWTGLNTRLLRSQYYAVLSQDQLPPSLTNGEARTGYCKISHFRSKCSCSRYSSSRPLGVPSLTKSRTSVPADL